MKKKLSLGERILLFVEENQDLYTMIARPSLWGKYRPSHQTFFNTIYRLKETGYLKEVEDRGRKKYYATLKGKTKILRFFKKDKKWDKKWRIVVFDIPEKKKKMREFFRGKLVELGFRKMQDSVWISPDNVAEQVEELIEFCQGKKYVHYLLVEELDNNDVLMKLFELSGKDTTHK